MADSSGGNGNGAVGQCKATTNRGTRCKLDGKYNGYCHWPSHRKLGDPSWEPELEGRCGFPMSRGRGPCPLPAGWGTGHPGKGTCKKHGGSAPTHERRWELERAREKVAMLGLEEPSRNVPPEQILLERLDALDRNVQFCERMIREMHDPSELVWELNARQVGGAAALPQGEYKVWARQPSVWVKMYNDYTDRLVKVAKMIIDCNLAERMLRLDEAKAMMLVKVFEVAMVEYLKEAGVDCDRDRARRVIGRNLRELTSAGEEVVSAGT